VSSKIYLSQGMYTLVDNDLFEYLNQWKWFFKQGYAVRNEKPNTIFMHRVINNTPSGYVTDHINRNRLDNRRRNLRTATIRDNARNRSIPITNRSGYIGVSLYKRTGSWIAYISINGKKKSLGYYDTIKEAVNARKRAEKQYYGLHTSDR
jgi:hypothetical protein